MAQKESGASNIITLQPVPAQSVEPWQFGQLSLVSRGDDSTRFKVQAVNSSNMSSRTYSSLNLALVTDDGTTVEYQLTAIPCPVQSPSGTDVIIDMPGAPSPYEQKYAVTGMYEDG